MKRNARVLLGLGLVGLGGWAVMPGMIHPISTDAMVNAEVVTLRAPVEGQLQVPGTLAVGERVATGDTVAWVRAIRPETVRRDGLALDLAGQRRLVEALAEEDASLARLEQELTARSQDYRAAARRRLGLAETEAAARLRAAEANYSRLAAELNRKQVLLAKDLVAPVAVEAARADERAAKAEVDAGRAELARVAAEAAAVRKGAFVVGGSDVSPYSDQRRDELRIKRAARAVEAAQARIRVGELTRQLQAEEAQAAKLSSAKLAAPVTGVVWQRFAAEGDTVRPGDPVVGLVDCKSLFLTAVLPKRYFADLKAGDQATARLSGVAEPVKAVIQSVRAGGGAQANGAAAVSPGAEEGRDVVITLAVHDRRLGNRSDNLCQVGQHATVTFATPALKPLVDAVADAIPGSDGAS
ncbi:MAG: HlyD family efflux transporter periplasmic adaptor subunit [Solirubrobacterales bacterium]